MTDPRRAEDESHGAAIHAFMREIVPLRRSLTGDGVRQTLRAIGSKIPLTMHEVPSGTPALDWTVPDEWNLRAAWIKGPDGGTVVDVAAHALHVVGYSVPIHRRMPLAELLPHLHSIPEHPAWIPYRTSYWDRTWGFCLTDHAKHALPEGEYEVLIDATLAPGAMTYGEAVIPGESSEEFLVSAHVCHPQMANDNQAGVALATDLACWLASAPRRWTYRFVFAPGTIGPIVWLSRNPAAVKRIRYGLVVANVGVGETFQYKQSRHGDAEIDRAASYLLATAGRPHRVLPFSPSGADERQYGSPGFDLPVGSLSRLPSAGYPEAHSSADDLALVTADALEGSFVLYRDLIDMLEHNRTFVNLAPYGEPQLGRRGLFRASGGRVGRGSNELALLWVLNQSDGRHSLLDIAERSGEDFRSIVEAARLLVAHGLLAEAQR